MALTTPSANGGGKICSLIAPRLCYSHGFTQHALTSHRGCSRSHGTLCMTPITISHPYVTHLECHDA